MEGFWRCVDEEKNKIRRGEGKGIKGELRGVYMTLRIMEKSIQRRGEGEGEEEIGIRVEVKKGVRWIEKWKKRGRKRGSQNDK